jgi:hypothetical protein
MKTSEEIESAMLELPSAQFDALVCRLGTQLQERWDRQMEADAASGRLDVLYQRLVVEDEREVNLDDFLDDQKFS